MGMSWTRTSGSTARSPLVKALFVIGLVAALTWGTGLSSRPAKARAATPQTAAAADPLAAWGVTEINQELETGELAVNPATDTVYVAGPNPGDLVVVNGLTGQVTGSLPVPSRATAATVNPATDTVYAIGGSTVTVIDAKTGTVTATIPDAGSPSQVAVDQETDTIYVLNASTVSVIDGSTNTVTDTINVGAGLAGIATDPATNMVYVTSFASIRGPSTVSVIDGATNTVTATIGVGVGAAHLTVDPVTNLIYVANSDKTLSEIAGATNTVSDTIDADGFAGIAADPRTDTIYLLSFTGELEGLNARDNEIVTSGDTSDGDPNTQGAGLAADPVTGTLYLADNFYDFDGERSDLNVIASCRSGVVPPAGSNCAKLAAEFQPDAVSFSSAAHGVAVGSGAMATADGGKHWSFFRLPPNLDFGRFGTPPAGDGLLFTSPDNGWLFGSWHTTDGGASWQHDSPGMYTLAMAATPTTVYAAVAPFPGHGELFESPIGATSWSQVPAITADATGLAASGHSVWLTSAAHLWDTTDGRHWRRYPTRCPGTGYRLAGVTATSPSRVAFLCARPAGTTATDPKEVLISTDGGRTVHLVGAAPALGNPQAFASPPGDPELITIAASGNNSSGKSWLYRSVDGGKTWTTDVIPHSQDQVFSSLTYTTRTSGWIDIVSPGHGDGLHTTDGGRTWHQVTF